MVVLEFRGDGEVSVHQPDNSYHFWFFLIVLDYVMDRLSAWATFRAGKENGEVVQRNISFVLSFFLCLWIFDDTKERPVSDDSDMTLFLSGISWLMLCPSSDSLLTDFWLVVSPSGLPVLELLTSLWRGKRSITRGSEPLEACKYCNGETCQLFWWRNLSRGLVPWPWISMYEDFSW